MRNARTWRHVLAAITITTLVAACSTGGPDPDGPADTGTNGASEETETGESSEGGTDDPAGNGSGVVRVVSHDSFDLPEELFEQFTEDTGYDLEFSAPGDAGALVNQLILTKDAPLGDVVYGVDNSFAARAIGAGIIADYDSPDLPEQAEEYLIGDGGLMPIDVGDVCLNVDHAWFAENDLPEPETFEDIAAEEYSGLTVLTNPAQSSPGLAFLLATIAKFGDDDAGGEWTGYWKDLMENGVKVVDGWSDAYYTDFTANGGSRPIALSYSTSPAFTIDPDGESTTGSMLDTCFRQIEYAGVLTGSENPEGAQAFVDFLLSPDVQAAIPESLFMYPVAPVDLPEEWTRHAPLSGSPHQVDPAEIEANLDDWLRTWQDDVIG